MANPTLPFHLMSPVIRPIDTEADLERILTLNAGAVPDVGAIDAERLRALIDQSLLALAISTEDDEQVVGFCLVLGPGADYQSVNYRWFSSHFGTTGEPFAYLDRVAIDPAFQRQGFGQKLYRFVESWLLEATETLWFCLEINLEPRNDISLAFHESLGFEEIGQQLTDYGVLVSLQTKYLGQAG
jgi:predicted GNAT superfamily acetyltransferase